MTSEPGDIHPPSSISHPCPILLAGPTAVGKSAIALMLAERLGGEIISVDSMQVYRDLRIITARPTPQEEARVPHRLYGHVDAAVNFSAGAWVAGAGVGAAHAAATVVLPTPPFPEIAIFILLCAQRYTL